MSTSPDQQVVECLQCGWPLLRGQPFTVVQQFCDDCDMIHQMGIVHTDVCAAAMLLALGRADTQQSRIRMLRVN